MLAGVAASARDRPARRSPPGREALVDVANQVAPLAFPYEPNAFALGDTHGYVAGSVAVAKLDPNQAELMATRIRQLGLDHVLYA